MNPCSLEQSWNTPGDYIIIFTQYVTLTLVILAFMYTLQEYQESQEEQRS